MFYFLVSYGPLASYQDLLRQLKQCATGSPVRARRIEVNHFTARERCQRVEKYRPAADAHSKAQAERPGIMLLAVTVLFVAIPPLIILYRILRVRVPGPLRPQTLLLGTLLDKKYIPDLFTRHRSLAKIQAEYGKTLRVVGPLGKVMVMFTGSIPKWFSGRDLDSGREGVSHLLPRSILGLPLGPKWSRHRRAIAPLFSAKSLEEQLPHVLGACGELVDSNLQAGVSDLYPVIGAWALDIIGNVAFGHEFGALAGAKSGRESRYATAAAGLNADILRRFAKGAFASLDRAACAKATADMEVFRETAAEIIRASAAADAPATLRSSFVARLAHKEKLAPEDCIQESVSLLIAGHETSSNTACWILHLLATNPEQQAKARAEADASPATPSYQDFLAMTTLVGAVYEALRLYTIIIGPAKKMTRDDQIPGVPKNTYVLPNKTVMGRRGHGVSFYGAFFASRVASTAPSRSESRIDGEVLLVGARCSSRRPKSLTAPGMRRDSTVVWVSLIARSALARASASATLWPSSSSSHSSTRCFAATNCSPRARATRSRGSTSSSRTARANRASS